MRDKLRALLDPTLFRFILVGLVNTAVGYGVMFGLYNLAGLHTWGDTGYWLSSAANYIVGSVVSFFLNKHFTFRSREKGAGVVLRWPAPACSSSSTTSDSGFSPSAAGDLRPFHSKKRQISDGKFFAPHYLHFPAIRGTIGAENKQEVFPYE